MMDGSGKAAGRNDLAHLEAIALGIRRQVLSLTIERGGCYLSQACSSAEILAVLFGEALNLGKSIAPLTPPVFAGVPKPGGAETWSGDAYLGPRRSNFDRFYLSPSHYCVALYATLIEIGRLGRDSLALFNQDGSTLEMIGAEHSPGMGLTTGSFGQTLSQVAGIALARRLRGETGRVWLFMSDGEFNEGQVWESMAFAAIHRLTEISIVVDVNGQQVDGPTEDVFDMGDLSAKLTAFGATVRNVDGHDIGVLLAAAQTKPIFGPLVILAYTDTARGIKVLESRKPDLHYVTIRNERERGDLLACLHEMGVQSSNAEPHHA